MANGDGDEATRRRAAQQDRVVEALGEGLNYADAGQIVGVDRRTITRWMTDPKFRARVSARRAEWTSQVAGELIAHAPDAVLAIRRELVDAERPADRLRAAALLLSLAHRFREQFELDERLREVEARLGLADHASASTAVDEDSADDDGGLE